MLSAAVLPALGIGDSLLMMIASHQLQKLGYQVTTFHNSLPELAPWFPGHDLRELPSEEKLIHALSGYHLIVVENDNSAKIPQLINAYRDRLSIFYPSYRLTKHAPLSPLDKVFDGNLPMAENIAKAIAKLTHTSAASKENGLTALPSLVHRLNAKQILIHPTSRVPSKNWTMKGYLKVAAKLVSKGTQPLFCLGPSETTERRWIEKEGFALAHAPTLSHLASLVYESGFVIGNDSLIGHLASNLGIPTLIIANDEKRMRLWRPGWLEGKLVLPPPRLPNWKFLRLKENHWQKFISADKVLRAFDKLYNPFLITNPSC